MSPTLDQIRQRYARDPEGQGQGPGAFNPRAVYHLLGPRERGAGEMWCGFTLPRGESWSKGSGWSLAFSTSVTCPACIAAYLNSGSKLQDDPLRKAWPCEQCGEPGHEVRAMTAYDWDGKGEDPNRPLMLCLGCEMDYVEHWQSQWDEYNASRL